MSKSIENVVFHIQRPINIPIYKGIPVYPAWPKLLHHKQGEARIWAKKNRNQGGKDIEEIETFNEFEAEVYSDVSIRGSNYSSKIPQAVIYLEQGVDGDPCYLLVDLRVDGFIEASIEFGIHGGIFTEPMAFRFSGDNYYLVPKAGTSYQNYASKFYESQKPKNSSTTQVEIGVPFLGNYGGIYAYLGPRKFEVTSPECSELLDTYKGQTVHVYQSIGGNDRFYTEPVISVSKNKMKVKGIYTPKSPEESLKIEQVMNIMKVEPIEVSFWTLAGYHVGIDIELDSYKITTLPDKNRICKGIEKLADLFTK